MLKEILSNEDETFTSGDIDSTILRALCTLLLITTYLGQPTVERDPVAASAFAQQLAFSRMRRDKRSEETPLDTPVVIDVLVEVE